MLDPEVGPPSWSEPALKKRILSFKDTIEKILTN
jgi:hypothetical protein